MKSIDADLSRFNSFYSLSCVEGYLLYILSASGFDYRQLYAQSNVSFAGVAEYFFKSKKEYAYFDRIPRLQSTAQAYSLIDFGSRAVTDLECDSTSDYCLIKLSPEYMREVYGAAAWREDHYVLLADYDGRRWAIINDTPRDYREVDSEKMRSAFAGEVMYIRPLGQITEREKRLLLRDCLAGMECYRESCPSFTVSDVTAARDALAVLRILRHRIYEYCSGYVSCAFMEPYLEELDRHFAVTEYMRLRGTADLKKTEAMFYMLWQKDTEVMTLLSEKLKEHVREIDEILKVISSVSPLEAEEIGLADELASVGIDSLKRVELLVALEDAFGITFDDCDLDPAGLINVSDAVGLTEKYLAER